MNNNYEYNAGEKRTQIREEIRQLEEDLYIECDPYTRLNIISIIESKRRQLREIVR